MVEPNDLIQTKTVEERKEKAAKKRRKKERKERKKNKRETEDNDLSSPKKFQKVHAESPQDEYNRPATKQSNTKEIKEKKQKKDKSTKQETTNPVISKELKQQDQRHPFQVDEADHCETPWRAYQDILPLLDKIAEDIGKERKNLIIYDPYYCDGGIRRKLNSLGCHKVINQNRDFYHDIQTNNVPPHDVLLTNPPYSGDHMESLLQFVSNNYASNKKKSSLVPFLLLLPHYVYTKPYFQQYFRSDARGIESNTSSTDSTKQHLFYLVPPNRYNYEPPSWVDAQTGSTAVAKGKTQTAPFPTFWYCHVSDLNSTPWLAQTFGTSGDFSRNEGRSHALQYANCTTHLPREFKGEFDVTNKRPNPRARKRMAAKKKQGNAISNSVQPKQQPQGNPKKKKKKRY